MGSSGGRRPRTCTRPLRSSSTSRRSRSRSGSRAACVCLRHAPITSSSALSTWATPSGAVSPRRLSRVAAPSSSSTARPSPTLQTDSSLPTPRLRRPRRPPVRTRSSHQHTGHQDDRPAAGHHSRLRHDRVHPQHHGADRKGLDRARTDQCGSSPTGGEMPTLYQYIGKNDALRARVTGTVPGTNNPIFENFRNLYSFDDGTSPDTFNPRLRHHLSSVVQRRGPRPDQPIAGRTQRGTPNLLQYRADRECR